MTEKAVKEKNQFYVLVKYQDEAGDGILDKLPRSVGVLRSKDALTEALSQDVDPQKTLENPGVEKNAAVQKITFATLQEAYFDQMVAFLDVLPMGNIAIGVGEGLFVDRLVESLEEISETPATVQGKFKYYTFGVDHYGSIVRRIERTSRQAKSMQIFPNLLLIGLVSQYDAYLGSLVRQVAEAKPHVIFGSNRTFTAQEVFLHTDVNTFREAVLAKEVETVLRKSHSDQFDWFEKNLGIPLTVGLACYPDFIEVCERRNLFAHTNGIVSEQYLLKCAEFEVKTDVKLGQQLSVDPNYLLRATEVFLEVGIKLAQVCARFLGETDQVHRDENKILNQFAYELLCHEHFELACRFLEFGFSKKMQHPDAVYKYMMMINHANAHKLTGRVDEAVNIGLSRLESA